MEWREMETIGNKMPDAIVPEGFRLFAFVF